LKSVHFTDNNTGWVVGVNGTIFKTVDGGEHWGHQWGGTDNHLYSTYFTDSNTGWIGGECGAILKTNDGCGVVSVDETIILPIFLNRSY